MLFRSILHKSTTKLVCTLHSRGVKTVVIGDVRDIRQDLDYGTTCNQRLHQWVHGQARHMITYKAIRLGIEAALQDERYTSRQCLKCNKRHKPSNRNYKCSCGFTCHRDLLGAVNIRRKYLGCFGIPVVGTMALPVGVRWKPHLQCSSASNC